MRLSVLLDGFKLWLSANDTYNWAHNWAYNWWPCSQLSNHRLFVEVDRTGLVDLAVDGKAWDGDANELLAIVSDHVDLPIITDRLRPATYDDTMEAIRFYRELGRTG